jgi:large conductance mechanosensitive channel
MATEPPKPEPKTIKEHKEYLEMAQAEAERAKRQAAYAKRELAKMREIADIPGEQLRGFVNFIREKGVVGLAVGLAIGTAATGLVTQIVNAFIIPMVGLIVGKNGLDGLNATISIAGRSEVFKFGDLVDALIKFIAIAAVIYFVVMGFKLDRLDKKKEE